LIIVRLILISTIIFSVAECGNIRWYGDYEKALILAKKQNKDLFVVVVSSNCKICKDDFSTIFLDIDVVNYINNRYISIIVTKEFQLDYPIELYYTTQYPSYFFASSKDEVFLKNPHYGQISKDSLLNLD